MLEKKKYLLICFLNFLTILILGYFVFDGYYLAKKSVLQHEKYYQTVINRQQEEIDLKNLIIERYTIFETNALELIELQSNTIDKLQKMLQQRNSLDNSRAILYIDD